MVNADQIQKVTLKKYIGTQYEPNFKLMQK